MGEGERDGGGRGSGKADGAKLRYALLPLSVQVSIYLPPLRLLKNILERMKNMSNFVVSC